MEEKREKYFKEADQRRALGQSMEDFRHVSSNLYKPMPQRRASQVARIEQSLRNSNIGG